MKGRLQKKAPSPAADPRRLTLFVLNRLESGNPLLDRILDDPAVQGAGLSRRDRNLFNELVFGVLRWRGRLDWVIDYFSKTPLKKIEPTILNILRIGAYQIIYLSRIPNSAAVNTSVTMAKANAPSWVTGFVNGLLRRISKAHDTVAFPDPDKDAAAALAAEKSFPPWLIQRWLDRYDFMETSKLCDAVNRVPPITVRTNTLKTSRNRLLKEIQPHVASLRETEISPDGITFSHPTVAIADLGPFTEGLFQVQDEAAQLVSLLLDPRPGESVLDACAGLGGKTGHIAQLMENRGTLVAMDRSEEKLRKLESEMNRLGVSIVKTCPHDLNKPLDENNFEYYHRVLLDAPCSGLGVLRRNPDAKWSVTGSDIQRSRKRQIEILSAAGNLVLPGGVLVYSVCSTEPEETESVCEEFLKLRTDYTTDEDFGDLPDRIRSQAGINGYLNTRHYADRMDGFFMVRFKKD